MVSTIAFLVSKQNLRSLTISLIFRSLFLFFQTILRFPKPFDWPASPATVFPSGYSSHSPVSPTISPIPRPFSWLGPLHISLNQILAAFHVLAATLIITMAALHLILPHPTYW
jgi:hypothetical protein